MRLLIAILSFLSVHLLGVPVDAFGSRQSMALARPAAAGHGLAVHGSGKSIQFSDRLATDEYSLDLDSAENQDEDEYDHHERRQVLLALGALHHSQAFILACLSSFPRQSLHFNPQPLYFGAERYIAQRVLRL